MGASGGRSGIVGKRLEVMNQLKQPPAALMNDNCDETAGGGSGWSDEWNDSEVWQKVGTPFLDGGEGKRRWRRSRSSRRGGTKRSEVSDGDQNAVSNPNGEYYLGNTIAEGRCTRADISKSCQSGNTSTDRATRENTDVLTQLESNAFSREQPNLARRKQPQPTQTGWIWAEDGKHSGVGSRLQVAPESDLARETPGATAPAPSTADDATMWHNLSTQGINHATLDSGARVDGQSKKQLRRENKARRIQKQVAQQRQTYWSKYRGNFDIPTPKQAPKQWRGDMCPSGLALHHPAAASLLKYATSGCPVMPGRDWTVEEIEAAVMRGPHVSALEPEAIEQLAGELEHKVKIGQARIVNWEDIKHDPPKHLKVSPLAMIPHKSRKYRAILDLSFGLRLDNGGLLESVNDGTVLSAPAGAIDQLGHTLSRIIHAFAEADEDKVVISAKWDIKDGFWRMQCQEGEEWNFCYVLPQEPGKPIKLVVPVSLQMGWVESPPYFCAASETARDIATQYVEAPMGTLTDNKFVQYAMQDADTIDITEKSEDPFRYFIDVYVDDFIALMIPTSKDQLRHVANAVMHGIHDVFPADDNDEEDPMSLKKLRKREGTWDPVKDILGFEFNGNIGRKDMILEEPKREILLTVLKKWIKSGDDGTGGIPFVEYKSVLQKLRHAFTALPTGRGLLSPLNKLLRMEPQFVFFHRNKTLLQAIRDIRTILRESTKSPTPCRQLVNGWPWYVGIVDASSHGVGGVIVGEGKDCVPTVFRREWPPFIKNELIKRDKKGSISNSDLEAAGLLLLWLVMEEVCDLTAGAHVALFNDNSPTVHWAERLTAKSGPAAMIVRALALRLKAREASPLVPLHIAGEENSITDIPSRSFGIPEEWFCADDDALRFKMDSLFPLPNQESWSVFHLTSNIFMRVTSSLQMKHIDMEEWRRLPKIGSYTGSIGVPMSSLWEWTLTFRKSHSKTESDASQALQHDAALATTVKENKLKLEQSLRRSRPLVRRLPWTSG